MSTVFFPSDSESSLTSSSPSCVRELWDVAEILAQRTSVTGDNELLVVWKSSWIPISNMQADGPVMRMFRNAPKCKFSSISGGMRLFLPMETGTVLAAGCSTNAVAANAAQASASVSAADAFNRTPRKALGLVAKRAPQSHQKRRKQ
jgi:hypothetical protein